VCYPKQEKTGLSCTDEKHACPKKAKPFGEITDFFFEGVHLDE